MSDDRGEALNHMYRLLDELDERHGPPRRLSECGSQSGWPDAGVYFFYEHGELRENGEPRLVRIGTHRLTSTSQSTLWDRLSQHRGSRQGGNHRGSIFRLHVGTALLASGDYPEATASWGMKQPPPGARANETRLERAVSDYIGAMPFRHVAVGSRSARTTIEAGAIALVSNFNRAPIDPASPGWLGHHADRGDVRTSHLWNVRHVRDSWSEEWLAVLASCVGGRQSQDLIAAENALPFTPKPRRAPKQPPSPRRSRSHAGEQFDTDLEALLREHVPPGTVVRTLGQGKPNTVVDMTSTGLVLQTERSADRGSVGEVVPAWMFNRAWEHLVQHGRLSRDHLLHQLNVKRSSAVFAVLAALPGMAQSGPPMALLRDG